MANLMDLANTAVRSVDERMVDGDDGDELRVRKRIRVANDTAPHAKNVQVQSIVDDVFRKIASREGQKITEDDWVALTVLFDKSLGKAVRLVDDGAVRQIIGENSKRSVWRVGRRRNSSNQKSRDSYLCFDKFCSCQSFAFDVIGKTSALRCKHQLAIAIAQALGRYSVLTVPDVDLAKILMTV